MSNRAEALLLGRALEAPFGEQLHDLLAVGVTWAERGRNRLNPDGTEMTAANSHHYQATGRALIEFAQGELSVYPGLPLPSGLGERMAILGLGFTLDAIQATPRLASQTPARRPHPSLKH